MEKKNNLAVIISCLSFAVALFCAVFIWCKSREVGHVVDLGTFIGICVGLIGVCATIMVGLQIWNHIEFKDVQAKAEQIDRIKEQITNDKLEIEISTRSILLAIDEILMSSYFNGNEDQPKIGQLILSIKSISQIPHYKDEYNMINVRLVYLHKLILKCKGINDGYYIQMYNNLRFSTELSSYEEVIKQYYKIHELINKPKCKN